MSTASAAIVPPRLRRGDTVGIVAPAGPVDPARLAAGLARFGDAFRVKLAPTLTQPRAAGVPSYLSASDDQRAEELTAMLADPDVRAVILARAGYGLTRILDRLDPRVLARDPKPIVGFSDATALLSWAYTSAGVRGIHGPMIVQMESLPDADIAYLVAMLTEARAPGVRPWTLAAHGQGRAEGRLVPANLTLASLLVATPWALPVDSAVLLLEEVGERPYELDRYLTQLRLTGQLARASAVVLGELTRCVDPRPPNGGVDPSDAALSVLVERLRGTPLVVGAPVGHGTVNEAVPFGAHAVVDLDARTVEITEAAVR